MKPKVKKGLCFLFWGWAFSAWSEGTDSPLVMELARYRYDERAVYVEVLYRAKPSTMTLRVERGDSLWNEQGWENVSPAPEMEGEEALPIGRAFFVAPQGVYHLTLESLDKEGERQVIRQDLEIHPYSPIEASLSDIALASLIRTADPSEEGHPFYKNSLFVLPNLTGRFRSDQDLFFYVECYNLIRGIRTSHYRFEATVCDTLGHPTVLPPIQKHKRKTHEAVVETGRFRLASLPPGVYELHLSLSDSLGETLSSRRKRFVCLAAPSGFVIGAEMAQSPFAGLEGPALKEEYEQAAYLMNAVERGIFKSLKDEEALRRGLFAFWKARDPSPQTPENEFYFEYKRRIQYANDQFTAGFQPGWRTDRGRIYCVYGKPSDIERHPSSGDLIPYEIWTYDAIEGGVYFIFADFKGMNQFVLIHSNKQGEVYNPNYMEMIQRGF